MARIYKNGTLADDTWHQADDRSGDESDASVIVPLQRWLALSHAARRETGVSFATHEAGDRDLAAVAQAPIVVIALPAFTDGRAYSLARRLREHHAYTGELRAGGDVLLDQIPLLERCGFSSFEVTHEPTLHALARRHVPSVAGTYQRGAIAGRLSIRPTLSGKLEESGT